MEGKRDTLLASTHTENFCTSYHGNINLEEKEQTLGDFHPKAFLKGKCPEAHPERKRQANGFVQNPDARCACTSCTYSPGTPADHCLTPCGTALLATRSPWPTCRDPSRAHGLRTHHSAAPIPAQNTHSPCSLRGIPDSLILVILLKIFFGPSGTGPSPRHTWGPQLF